MPNPTINTTPPPEEIVIAAILARLRANAALTAANVAIEGPEGDPSTLAVLGGKTPNVPNRSQLPLIRLTVGDYPTGWENESQHRGQLALLFDLYCLGTHYADRFRLLSLFISAMEWGGVDSAYEIRPKLTSGGAMAVSLGEDDYGQVSRVAVTVAINHDT